MKTKLLVFAAIVCSLIGISQKIYAETNYVDTIANQLKGVWFKVYEVNDTGYKRTIYNSDSTVISQIPGTDSITWKDYEKGIEKRTVNYCIKGGISYLTNQLCWKLEDELMFSIHKDTLQLKQDFPDGYSWGYARSNVPSVTEEPPYGVDSVTSFLKGKWYKVYAVTGYTGFKRTIYNSDSTVINRIPGTDSVTWINYENGVVKRSINYAMYYAKSNIRSRYYWKLANTQTAFTLLLTFTDSTFQTAEDIVDGSAYGYARSNVPTGINYPTQHGNILFLQPTNNQVSIQGVTSIDRLEIRDLYGRIQRQIDRVDVGESIDISSLSAGIYLVKVYSGKETYSSKLIRR